MTQVEVREALISALQADLVGPMAPDEVLETRPSRWYVAGFLVPDGTPLEDRQDPEAVEEISIDADRGDDEDDDVRAHRVFLPSSLGLSFLVGPRTKRIEVAAGWADYEVLDPEQTREHLRRERERRGHAEPEEEVDPRFRYWRRQAEQRPVVTLRLGEGVQQEALTADRGVYVEAVVRPAPSSEGPPGTRVVSLFLVNGREPRTEHPDGRYLFQARLEVTCAEGFLPRVGRSTSGDPDERRNDLQYRDQPQWAVGHGLATVAHAVAGICRTLRTTWVPRATVHGTTPREVEGVNTRMDLLAEVESPEQVAAGVGPLLDAYAAWLESQAGIAASLVTPARRQTAERLVEEAGHARRRLASGLQRLADDPLAFEAFKLTNAVMAQTARKQRPHLPPSWRLFQLAFLLLNIDGVVDPDHADRQRVELLFFPTGGGKTEAYLGVAAFAAFLRRLRGQEADHKGAGVAILLRYTLRLLTIDQLQRAAQLVCAMELARRAAPARLGPHRFAVGIWVGRKATANKLADLKPVIRALHNGRPLFGEPAPLPLKSCPWCDTPFDADAYQLLPPRSRAPHSLVVSCANDDCEFNAEYDEAQPEHRAGLPIVTVDEHVYRELPTILIGTVDKFASLPWRGASGNLFGRVRAEGDAGFYGADEKPPPDASPLPGGLLPPELIIQDELHLITGPLGTMVGLYETVLDALCRDKVPQGPKIIASTATARAAQAQIQAIFVRPSVHLFPPQGVDAGDTFFSSVDSRPEKSRLYVGIAAPGRSMKLLTSRAYTCLLGAAQRQWEGAPGGADNPADNYMTLVAYFNALKELGGAQRIFLEEVNSRVRQLSRRRPLDDESSEHFANRVISYDVLELTSRQTTDQISEAIEVLRKPFSGRGKLRSDVLLASSMISVGVDISRLGLMLVNGQPRTVAEYIQASSRVGRSSPGLVVTAFNLFRPRDRSHYERFEAFHSSFYRFVEAASVTPFSARAVDRGLAGLVVGLARHLPPRLAHPAGAAAVPKVEDLGERIAQIVVQRAQRHKAGFSPLLADRLTERVKALISNWGELVDAIHENAGGLVYSSWEKKGATSLLSTAIDDLEGELAPQLDQFRAPTSMRDVEPAVHIWVDQTKREGH